MVNPFCASYLKSNVKNIKRKYLFKKNCWARKKARRFQGSVNIRAVGKDVSLLHSEMTTTVLLYVCDELWRRLCKFGLSCCLGTQHYHKPRTLCTSRLKTDARSSRSWWSGSFFVFVFKIIIESNTSQRRSPNTMSWAYTRLTKSLVLHSVRG